MKKVLFSVAMIAAFAGVMMTSCKKENETVSNEKGQIEVNDPQNDAEVNRILDFKNKVDERKANPGMKSGETMTLEEAMDNVVDLFNVTYTEPMAYYTTTESHQFSINVPLTVGGEVLVDDVVAAYEQAVAEAREAYHTSSLANKSYRRLMVTFDMQRDGEVSLDFDGQYGSKTDHPQPPTPHIDGPFSVGDDWHYMDGMGSCDGLRPGGADAELTEALKEDIRTLWPIPYDGGRGVFIHLVKIDFKPMPSNTQNVFYRSDIEDTCIEWQEMNDLLHYEKILAFDTIPSHSNDPVIVLHPTSAYNYKDYVTAIIIHGDSDGNTFIRHNTTVEYGRYLYVNSVIDFNEL